MKQDSQVLTRRGVLLGGASLLGASALSILPAVANAAVERDLIIVGSTDPQFKAMVQSMFPGLWEYPAFQALKASVFLVTNPTNHNVKAFTATWTFATPSGPYQISLHHCVRPGERKANGAAVRVESDKKGTLRVPKVTGHYSVIRGNETNILSPFFFWSVNTYTTNQARWKKMLHRNASKKFMLQQVGAAAPVSLAINTIIYRDGYLKGSTSDKLVHQFCIRRNAEHDAAHHVNTLLNKNLSPTQIIASLKARNVTFAMPRTNWKHTIYRQARARASIRYIMLLNNGDMGAVQAAIAKPLGIKKTTTNRLHS
jgi:hypothetical protein